MSLPLTHVAEVDLRELHAQVHRFKLAPAEFRKTLRLAAQFAINTVRKDVRREWLTQKYARHGPGLHRRAIASGVRTTVRVSAGGNAVTAAVGIKRSGSPLAVIVNVLEGGFLHRASGKRVAGKRVRARLIDNMRRATKLMVSRMEMSAYRALTARQKARAPR